MKRTVSTLWRCRGPKLKGLDCVKIPVTILAWASLLANTEDSGLERSLINIESKPSYTACQDICCLMTIAHRSQASTLA